MNLIFLIIISSVVPLLVTTFGDSLYVGLWYYLLVPFVIIFLHKFMFNFEMPFYIGLSTGISLSFVFFLSLNWFNIVNDSLIGLLHAFFVLPGIIFSLVMSSPYLEEKKILKTSNKFKIFLIALLTIFIGFILGFIMYILLVIFQRV